MPSDTRARSKHNNKGTTTVSRLGMLTDLRANYTSEVISCNRLWAHVRQRRARERQKIRKWVEYDSRLTCILAINYNTHLGGADKWVINGEAMSTSAPQEYEFWNGLRTFDQQNNECTAINVLPKLLQIQYTTLLTEVGITWWIFQILYTMTTKHLFCLGFVHIFDDVDWVSWSIIYPL